MDAAPHPRAVLFDLFNTLIPGGSAEERDDVSRKMADILQVDSESFADMVRQTFGQRCRGTLGDLNETIGTIANRLGGQPSEQAIRSAARLRLDFARSLHSRTWALPVLVEIERVGIVCGLVSDCSAETPDIWPESPLAPYFRARSFSCETGHCKPEPEAYLAATKALGVRPQNCVYVGDGGSDELRGATELGMRAVRFYPSEVDRPDDFADDLVWEGDTIAELAEVLPLLVGSST